MTDEILYGRLAILFPYYKVLLRKVQQPMASTKYTFYGDIFLGCKLNVR